MSNDVQACTGQVWAEGDAYEPYVGRWSRLAAREFLNWLDLPVAGQWLDVGSGTGALSQAIIEIAAPREVVAVDKSEGFVAYARGRINSELIRFEVGDAAALRLADSSFDVTVSGLVLNFVPQPESMVREMKRVVRPGGTVALYVWDYAGEMQLMRYFWDAATALSPDAHALDEGIRFPICEPKTLSDLFRHSGLRDVGTRAIDVPTDFQDFDDYWSPFLGGQGPAPSYAMSLGEDDRAGIRDYIRARLPIAADGSIHLIARAWAVRGIVT